MRGELLLLLLLAAVLCTAPRAYHRIPQQQTTSAPTFTALPLARQTQHQGGVPHTDKVGRVRTVYKPGVSFLPLALYHTIIDSPFKGENYSATEYRDAGFNTLHFWPGYPLQHQIGFARANGFQAIPQIGTAANGSEIAHIIQPFVADESVLGWMLEEEPTGSKSCYTTGPPGSPAPTPVACTDAWSSYVSTKQAIKKVDTMHALFNLDCPWTDVDSAGHDPRSWWIKWNAGGEDAADVSVHDNYPFPDCDATAQMAEYRFGWDTLDRKQGITETVALAVNLTKQEKPVWLTIQAFEQPGGPNFWWTMPTEAQLRVQAYTAVVLGASGLIHFALDSWVTRVGQVIGIGPRTPFMTSNDNGGGTPLNASESSRHASQLLWGAATRLNAEMSALESAILSPTSTAPYSVAFNGNNLSATPLRSVLKVDPTRGLVLIVVNVDAGTMHGRISFESAVVPRPASSYVQVLFEGGTDLEKGKEDASSRRLPVANASSSSGAAGWSITDFFGGFESHVFALA